MGFFHVEQAGLKLLTSDDPPAAASQSAGITEVNYHTWPENYTSYERFYAVNKHDIGELFEPYFPTLPSNLIKKL